MLKNVTGLANKWRSDMFYPFFLRPRVVNTYLYSSIWYKASVLNLRLGDMDKLQQRGNGYIYSDSFLRPEKFVNYASREMAGLGSIHVKSKCNALFVRNFLLEPNSGQNCYANAVFRKYCLEEEVSPIPVKPPFLNNNMIECIKLVSSKCKELSTKDAYKVLLDKEFAISEEFKYKIEQQNTEVDVQKVSVALNSKLISLPVRSLLFRFFHMLLYFEPEESKIRNTKAICKLCDEVDITRCHIYFRCSKLYGIGREFMRILRVLDPKFTEDDVLFLTAIDPSIPQTSWIIANSIFYISNNRERCSIPRYRAFLSTELETLKHSKQADPFFITSLEELVELVGVSDE